MKMQITLSPAGQEKKLQNKGTELDVIYKTTPPGGMFGYYGPDVCNAQWVAIRFTPKFDHYLKKLGLWFMNNGVPYGPLVKVSLRKSDADANNEIPASGNIEEWKFNVSAIGWNPELMDLNSEETPLLQGGNSYWIVAESGDPCEQGGVWAHSSESIGFFSVTNDGVWQAGVLASVPAIIIWGTTPV